MKGILISLMCLGSFAAFADTPRPRVEFASGLNGYAIISGSLETQPAEPIGVTVEMSGFRYSTVTDRNGKWSVVIRQTSVNYAVESYSLSARDEKSETLKAQLK